MEARLKLAQWIAGQDMKKGDAAKMLGTNGSNLTKWLTGRAQPSLKAAFVIETHTGIQMEEWLCQQN